MRWTVIGLLLLNIMFLIWNWLEYSHLREVGAMSVSESEEIADMPGDRLILLREWTRSSLSSSGGNELLLPDPQQPQQVAGPPLAAVDVGNASSEAAEGVSQCVLLGPYPDAQSAKPLLDRLGALQIEAKYAAVQVDGESDYWVYLRPEASREFALAKLKELQEKKIDSFIISQGEITNGISLGVFDKQENAERRRQEVVELGYDAQVRTNPRSYMENWVVIYPTNSARFSLELYNQLKIDNNKLDLRKEECSKVASPEDIH